MNHLVLRTCESFPKLSCKICQKNSRVKFYAFQDKKYHIYFLQKMRSEEKVLNLNNYLTYMTIKKEEKKEEEEG